MPRGVARWDEVRLQGQQWRPLNPLPEFSPLVGSENDGLSRIAGDDGFSNVLWYTSAVANTPNSRLAPNGTTTAARFLDGTSGGRHIAYTGPSGTGIIGGGTYCFSVYAKNVSRRYMQLLPAAANGTGSSVSAFFDLQVGQVTDFDLIDAAVNGAAHIAPAANGFWKCSIIFRLASNVTAAYLQIAMSDVATFGSPLVGNSPSYTGTNAQIDVWRPRLTLL